MDNNLEKIERFFKYDLEVKKILNNIVPNEKDFYSDEYRMKYVDKLFKSLDDISFYINNMMGDYLVYNDTVNLFNKKIETIKGFINSESFYRLMDNGYESILKFVNLHILSMRASFVESVNKGFFGYRLFYGDGVLTPISINEFLHYVHSYIINNIKIYRSIPILKSSDIKDNSSGVVLRGNNDDLADSLYEKILKSNLNSYYMDIISLKNVILIMVRDLGHATVFEIDRSDNNCIFVKYFIPSNIDMEKNSHLKGINANKSDYAIGEFQTSKDNMVKDICTLMSGIATETDIKINNKTR